MRPRSAAKVIRTSAATGQRLCDVEGCDNFANNFIQPVVNLHDPSWLSTPGHYRCNDHSTDVKAGA